MAYSPTHDAPAGGLPAYTAPDPTQAPVAQLDPGLDVQLLERRADWAHVVCSNGWEAWVDARRLVARAAPTPEPAPPPPPPPAATAPVAATAPTAETTPAPAATTETPAVSTAAPTPAPATSTPPSEGWTVPATGAPATAASGSGVKIGPGQIVALAGAAIVLLSAWFSWIDAEDGDTLSAYEIGSKILFDNSIEDKGLIGIGYLLLVCVVAIVVGVFVKPVRFLSIVGGALAAVIALLFVFQINNFLGNIEDDFGQSIDLFDFISYLPLVAAVGGIVAAVGGVLALRQK
jgi:hypothetical protein